MFKVRWLVGLNIPVMEKVKVLSKQSLTSITAMLINFETLKVVRLGYITIFKVNSYFDSFSRASRTCLKIFEPSRKLVARRRNDKRAKKKVYL